MQRISPTLRACHQFRQKPKKVKFDSARVSFQVEYDIADDSTLRQKIPVWTEHWKRSKTGLLCQLLRSLSCHQWLKTLLFCVSFTAFSLQIYQTFKQYLSLETLVSAHFRLPDHFRFPALSLCVPIVVPFATIANPNSADCAHNGTNECAGSGRTARDLLNASIARAGHRCKYSDMSFREEEKSERLVPTVHSCQSLSPSVEWSKGNEKCFTYFSLLSQKAFELREKTFETQFAEQLAINLVIINSNFGQNEANDVIATLFVHQSDAFPFALREEAIVVRAKRRYEIKYFSTKTRFLSSKEKKCENYAQKREKRRKVFSSSSSAHEMALSHSDCLSRCLLAEMRSQCVNSGFSADIYRTHCLSRFSPLRHDLLETNDKFCAFRDNNKNNVCNNHELYRKSIDQKCGHVCPEDCSRETFHLSVSEHLSNDLSETNVTLVRKLSPDLSLIHVPQVTCTQLMAQLGGLAAFWSLFYLLLIAFLRLIQYIWELIEIYYL